MPGKLHELHNNLPFLPERMKLEKVKKFEAILYDKTEYVIHIWNLKQALDRGLIKKLQKEARERYQKKRKERSRKKAQDRYQNFSEEEKEKKCQYGNKNRDGNKNLSEEEKEKKVEYMINYHLAHKK